MPIQGSVSAWGQTAGVCLGKQGEAKTSLWSDTQRRHFDLLRDTLFQSIYEHNAIKIDLKVGFPLENVVEQLVVCA